MSGVLNNTARIITLRAMDKKSNHKVTVRLSPGLNDVRDDHWVAVKEDAYTKRQKKDRNIDFGKGVDDMLLEEAPSTKSMTKSESNAKLQAELVAAQDAAKEQTLKAGKLEDEAKEAKARAEKAELELEQLKKSIAGSSKEDKK